MPPLRHRATALALLTLAASPACHPPTVSAPVAAERRAIVLSLDSFNEARLRASLPPDAIPAITAVFDGGACAASARPAFPSVTAAGHASLWTGAYGDVNGITANSVPQLPRDAHTLLALSSGFHPGQLRAEPIWVTTALSGVPTVGHHTTQSPGAPGYPAVQGAGHDARAATLRARADSALRSPMLHVLNGYDEKRTDAQLVTERSGAVKSAAAWPGVDPATAVPGAPAPRELAVPIGTRGDSLYVLLLGTGGAYTHALVAGARDASRAVMVRPAPVESAPPRDRMLARHFSSPLALTIGGVPVRTHVRLFDLAADGTRFSLFVPTIAVIAANHESTRGGYEAASAWVGNSAGSLLVRGVLGPTIGNGGDGTAERRWLETAELMTRESIAGARWMWTAFEPRLFLDYFALGDDTDHTFWGMVTPGTPGFDAAKARRAQEIRAHAWALVDERVRAMQELARSAGAALFLSGDHGMRATWASFRPNALLAKAGLLAVDTAGRIDLARTRAVASNGYWISVNRTAWRGGIVAPHQEREVIDSVVAALRAARASDGSPIVTGVYRAAEHDSLGLGGPNGGDVYFELAPGYAYDGAVGADVTVPRPVAGSHGFASVSADMHTVLCAFGAPFGARRLPVARTIDLAPTVLEWIGVPPAATVRGRSLLAEMTR